MTREQAGTGRIEKRGSSGVGELTSSSYRGLAMSATIGFGEQGRSHLNNFPDVNWIEMLSPVGAGAGDNTSMGVLREGLSLVFREIF